MTENQNIYQNTYGGSTQQEPQNSGKKGEGVALGIASFVLGVVSLLLFCCCINWVTGILAIIFGIVQLVKHKEKGFAIAGIITAGVSLLLAVILYISLFAGLSAAGITYEELYDSYYDDSYYDDSYYDDSYYEDFYDSYYDDSYYDDDYDYYYDDYYDGGTSYPQGGGPQYMSTRSCAVESL